MGESELPNVRHPIEAGRGDVALDLDPLRRETLECRLPREETGSRTSRARQAAGRGWFGCGVLRGGCLRFDVRWITHMNTYKVELERCLGIIEAKIDAVCQPDAPEDEHPDDSVSFAFSQIVRIFDERLAEIESRIDASR